VNVPSALMVRKPVYAIPSPKSTQCTKVPQICPNLAGHNHCAVAGIVIIRAAATAAADNVGRRIYNLPTPTLHRVFAR
jgi:hypothetical protein